MAFWRSVKPTDESYYSTVTYNVFIACKHSAMYLWNTATKLSYMYIVVQSNFIVLTRTKICVFQSHVNRSYFQVYPQHSIKLSCRAHRATLKVGGGGRGGWLVTQWVGRGGGWKHLFLSNSLKFPKKWGAGLAPAPPRALSCIDKKAPSLKFLIGHTVCEGQTNTGVPICSNGFVYVWRKRVTADSHIIFLSLLITGIISSFVWRSRLTANINRTIFWSLLITDITTVG